MNQHHQQTIPNGGRLSRRTMLQKSLEGGAGLAAGLALSRSVHAAGSDLLKVGLVGCGGRGTGAACDAMAADKGAKLVALADAFPEPIQSSLAQVKKAFPDQVDVKDDRKYVGLDAYKHLLASDVDVVLLALPSHFHCIYLKAAVEAGKHVFCEKPHATDPVGVRMIAEAAEIASKKNLAIVSGLCWRYDMGARETVKRIHDGAIGRVVAVRETYMTGFSWIRPRKPQDTEMMYQVRNWYNFHWLSGDLPGLTLIHSIDKGAWALGDRPPVRAWGMGGRQVRTAPEYGDVFDHFGIVYEYADGAQMLGCVRQQNGCFNEVADHVLGTKGRAYISTGRIEGENPWRFSGTKPPMHRAEHQELFASIRAGKPINNGSYMVTSTMLVVMGRMACYSGQAITWDEAMKSPLNVGPSRYAFDADPPIRPDKDGRYPIAIPGVGKPLG